MLWREEHGRTAFDALVACTLVAGFLIVMMAYFEHAIREARETALKMGLANIRMSVRLFHALNERNPGNITDLLTQKLLFPTSEGTFFSDSYLQAQALDNQGYPVDPFGHRYRYGQERGSVSSTTKGYEQW
ncbi:MAG: hypothetical protein HY207_07040 [Nitrospirae bacterium]|nr:hypothetical protein [Nitrospirota bacterium]